jgi:hypothetical protein
VDATTNLEECEMSVRCDWCGKEIASPQSRAMIDATGMLATDPVLGPIICVGSRNFHAGSADDRASCLVQALTPGKTHAEAYPQAIRIVNHRQIARLRSKQGGPTAPPDEETMA